MTTLEQDLLGTCCFCRQPCMKGDRHHYEVIGFEVDRRVGGTNAIRLRKRTGVIAHTLCVDKAVAGRTDQPELFD